MQKLLNVVILAAGKGTRMNSKKPKVLHKLAGRPMIKHIIDAVNSINPKKINVIYGFSGELLREELKEESINWIYQEQQLGTGHAMLQAAPFFSDDDVVLMLYGDGPLITANTLQTLIDNKPDGGIALLTVILENPFGYGRIIRNQDNNVIAIVEEKDADIKQKQIKEINTGIMVSDGKNFRNWLARIENNNAQKEYYITDVIAMAYQENKIIKGVCVSDSSEVEGVNDHKQLANQERYYQEKQANLLLQKGVKLYDPKRFDLRGSLSCGQDVEIDINVIIEGDVVLGNNVTIGAGCILKNTIVGDNVEIKPYSIIEDATIGVHSIIGPFARIRPGVDLVENARIGNFVEIKKARVGKNSKINHLSYVGDAEIGENCNIGAGVITCNYDGKNKFKTTIGNNVFVGSDVQLIAPVSLANNVTVAAGSTVTSDVSEDELVISRVQQKHIPNWKKKHK